MMKVFLVKKPGTQNKYVKCSNCKIFDSIDALINEAKCPYCHQPFKEISEEEYKQKLETLRKLKEERRRKNNNNNNIINNNNNNNNYRKNNNSINNNNINNNNQDNYGQTQERQRNNSSLHSSKIQFDDGNNGDINNNNINNINNENNNNQPHHHHNRFKVKIIKTGHHNLMILGRDHSSERGHNISHSNHNNNMIIIRPATNQINHQNNNNININNQNEIQNQNQNQNRNIQIIQRDNRNNPFRIVLQRHHVPNDVFDPNFNIFGSTFNHVFQDNFSSNFRSNFRGNFLNIIFDTLSRNRADLRRSKHNKPISEENIKKLKRFNLTEKYCKKDSNDNFEKPTCTICLEQIEIGKDTILLPCGHMYHADCSLNWLKTSNTCPICRFEIK